VAGAVAGRIGCPVMNLLVALTVFPVIFIGELPDKSMFASLVLATKGRPGAVWVGASLAFAIHVVFAVTLGTVAVLLLPRRVLDVVVAVLFLFGALLSVRELVRARRMRDEDEVETAPVTGFARAALTTFGVVFVAEWGDLTQILAANLAAHYRDPLAVGVGATVALWAVAGVAVIGGRWLGRVIDATILRAVTAVVLAGFAGYAGWLAANA
jgi:Ca2+/H+ antiporter, TMEM165/GDT1 family